MKVAELRREILLQKALAFGRQWSDQDGVNASVLEDLATAARDCDASEVDVRLAIACRAWHDGALGREAFFRTLNELLEPEPRKMRRVPMAVLTAHAVLADWDRGVCPEVASAPHACDWICGECKEQRPAGRTSQGEVIPGRTCAKWEER